jgi:ribosomal protein S18 acetylase RimI-like enzyme
MPDAAIRPMTAADIDAVGQATAEGGFGDRREFFGMTLALGDCRPIVAVEGDRIVGTGVGAVHGRVGWIGVIFVAPELRRRGIGRALTEHVCEDLEHAGCRSLVLVATDLGRPLYERLGFRVASQYHMFSGDPLSEAPAPPSGAILRPVRPGDLEALCALDRKATGEDRRPLIEHYAGAGWLLENPAGPRAFLLPTHRGNGALVAGAEDDALCLLNLHRHLAPKDGHAWAGLPTENEAGRRLLTEESWYAWRTFPRMVRGDETGWQPAMIWAQFNHAMG